MHGAIAAKRSLGLSALPRLFTSRPSGRDSPSSNPPPRRQVGGAVLLLLVVAFVAWRLVDRAKRESLLPLFLLERREAKMREAVKAQSQMTGIFGHEARTAGMAGVVCLFALDCEIVCLMLRCRCAVSSWRTNGTPSPSPLPFFL